MENMIKVIIEAFYGDDRILEVNSFRELPWDELIGSGRTITIVKITLEWDPRYGKADFALIVEDDEE